MTDPIPANPYQPSETDEASMTTGLTFGQAVVLTLLSLVLILRGGLLLLQWTVQLSSGLDLGSNFFAAMFAKDMIYGVSALVGGILLLFRHRVGWWAAVIHWCWYLACEIVVVATAAVFDWRVPVHHPPPMLYSVLAMTALLGFAGLAILFWRPVVVAYRGPIERRRGVALAAAGVSVILAFGCNGWMSLR